MRGPGQPPPSFDDAVARIRVALAERPARSLAVPAFRPAGVAVLLLARPDGPTILFTVRAGTLAHHRGEIAFPGGGCVPGEDPAAAALREAEEEVGLPRAEVELLGALDDLPSISRYVVTPVVAAVRDPPAVFVHDAAEVAEAFEIPFATLLDPGVRRAALWDPGRLPPEVVEMLRDMPVQAEELDPATGHWRVWSFQPSGERNIWGLTARILADLLDRAFPAEPGAPARR
jgi:8-oxo-dGTP pyrophosphatase MutT (NUDIX family)